jgi:hypothetical protein
VNEKTTLETCVNLDEGTYTLSLRSKLMMPNNFLK